MPLADAVESFPTIKVVLYVLALGLPIAVAVLALRMWPQPRKKRLPKARHRAVPPKPDLERIQVVPVWREDERRG